MSSRDTNPNIPNAGGSGRARGNAREDGPVNTIHDTFKRAAPFWHERLAGRALALGTGLPWDTADSIVEAIAVLIEQGETAEQVRIRLNPSPFGRLRAEAVKGAEAGLRETIEREFGS